MKNNLFKKISIIITLAINLSCASKATNQIGIEPLTQAISATESTLLIKEVESKQKELENLIYDASQKGINTLKEQTTLRTAQIFMGYADWDSKNIENNVEQFKLSSIFEDQADMYAQLLPDFERNEILLMLNSSITELKRVLNGEIVRLDTPKIDWSETTTSGDEILYKGKTVFLADWIWKPQSKLYNEFHGALSSGTYEDSDEGGFFLTPSYVVKEDGTLDAEKLKKAEDLDSGTMSAIFMDHTTMPKWAEEKDPNILKGNGGNFVKYDINNPVTKDVLRKLIAGFAPYLKDKNRSKLGYMMCNEPHWNTIEGTWASVPISDIAIQDFKKWLQEKHKDIGRLNQLWNTSYKDFNSIDAPNILTQEQQGSALYFDFMSYNNFRVTQWFSFLSDEIKKYDPNAKTHIKLIPDLWGAGKRDHGLDFEVLTRNSDIIGNDGGSCREPIIGEIPEWSENFDFNWKSFCMNFDFFKSISPEKVMYNSEAHFLSKVNCRDLYLEPEYVRCNYWLAVIHGMDVAQTWYWSRKEDGSAKIDKSFAGSNNMQPRVVNEVHTTFADLNSVADIVKALQRQRKSIRIFYSKASSINDIKYMDNISNLYQNIVFEGIPIGFATEGIIQHNDNKNWDVIIVYKTPKVFNSDIDKLQEYLDKGGVVVVDENSLKSNEYGEALHSKLKQSNGTLIVCNSLSDLKEKTIKVIEQKGEMPLLSVTQENGLNQKGCLWRVIKGDDGANYLNIANVGKNNAKINISYSDGTVPKSIVNGINMEKFNNSFEMKPCDIYLLKIN